MSGPDFRCQSRRAQVCVCVCVGGGYKWHERVANGLTCAAGAVCSVKSIPSSQRKAVSTQRRPVPRRPLLHAPACTTYGAPSARQPPAHLHPTCAVVAPAPGSTTFRTTPSCGGASPWHTASLASPRPSTLPTTSTFSAWQRWGVGDAATSRHFITMPPDRPAFFHPTLTADASERAQRLCRLYR